MKKEDNIGSRIKEMRKAVGMSQAELGQRIGRSNQTVSMYEIGTADVPDDVVEMIADVFGVTADWLRDGDECYTPVSIADLRAEAEAVTMQPAKESDTMASPKVEEFMSANEKYFADEVQRMHNMLFKQIFTAQMQYTTLKKFMEKLGLQAEFTEYVRQYNGEV